MKIKKLSVRPKLAALILAGALSSLTLTGCGNYDAFDTKYDYNKAIIFGENTATIVEIEKWTDYDGEQLQILTKDGLYMVTSSFDTKLIDDKNTNLTAEDVARSIMGDEVEIKYLDEQSVKSK